MGGILYDSKENELLKYIRMDNPNLLKDFLINNNIEPDNLYTNRKRTLIQLCCYFSSPKCLSKLIEMNYDYNKKEISNDFSPLYIACKFNCLKIVKILLSKEDCNILQKNNDNYNEFEIAFLKGNYDICYYLLFQYKNNENNLNENKNNNNKNNNIYNKEGNKIDVESGNKEKTFEINMNHPYQKFFFDDNFNIDKYISIQASEQFPLFNMKLFYTSLCHKIPPEKCYSFAPEKRRTKDLLTKIPDPNETWGHFFKRLINLELYNPPLVDKRNISHMNSLYMNTQMKLLENEYGIKMDFYNPYEETNNNIDYKDEEESPIIKYRKKKSKEVMNISENETKNDLKRTEKESNENSDIVKVFVNKRNKEKKIEPMNFNTNNNLCVLNINTRNTRSSERKIKTCSQGEDEKQKQ